ncbi:F-box/FBD/LRR-repeat protein At1g13570-like isoform X2 [Mercurialis annua]|nr:F-box/FBD/LRR-repeat protein At1g13570-like isoform X2 [Mercurialis annua]
MDNQPVKKIDNSSRSDRISNLPNHIIDNILSCLSIHEAVGTSILSKKWRFRWRYLPNLVFDDTFYETSMRSSTTKPSITKFFLDIYSILLLHQGPIMNFTFYVPSLDSFSEIDRLMLYLSEKDVQEFFLNIEGSSHIDRLPSFLFSCVTMRRLTLTCCSFTVPLAFQGFVTLISLKFQSVRFKTNLFETFISKCPLLETLSIKSCSGIDDLDIDIPYLKYFHFHGPFKAICFRKTCLHLSKVIISNSTSADNFSGPKTSEPTKLFESLPAIDHLRLGYQFVDYLIDRTVPIKLSATLDCLRVLNLSEMCFRYPEHVSVVLRLIVSSLNLQFLAIESFAYTDEIPLLAPELLKVEGLLDNALKKLRVVKMTLPNAEIEPELEFIKFLLAESVALEKMIIQPSEETEPKQALNILKEITRFQRSSKKAEILFLDPQYDDE